MIGLKLKYKKLVLLISAGTICIGGIAYTLVNHNTAGKNQETTKTEKHVSVTDNSFSSGTYETESGNITLEKNANAEINDLVAQYLAADVKCDMDALGNLVSDIENVNEENLKAVSEYVEGYENIDCYTAAGLEDDTYVVLARSDLKFKNIETLAPGLTGFYVKKDTNGNWVIYTGILTDEESAYQESVYECEGVKDLISDTEAKYKEALENDKDLSSLYAQLQEKANSVGAEGETEVSPSPEATKEAE